MTKKIIKIVLLVLAVSVAFIIIRSKADSDKKRDNANLIIISADALRPDHLGVYGYKKNTSPNIDKWSKDAFIFDNMRTVIPLTYPSFAVLYTSLYPAYSKIDRNVINQPISPDATTLVSILKKNGFANGAFLSSDVLNKDINIGLTNLAKDFDVYESIPYKNNRTNDHEQYEKFISKAISWFINSKGNRKFLWLHLMNTHGPYYPPSRFQCTFNQKYCEQIKNMSEDELAEEEMNLEGCQDQIIPQEKIELHETLYDGEIAYLDKIFGDIIGKLKEKNLDENTVIVFLSDHGEGFDHNYNFIHGNVLYDSSLRIPLIIKVPWLNPNKKRISDSFDNADIMPTLIELLGLKTGNSVNDGVIFNLKKISRNKKAVYSVSAGADKYSVVDGKYKYIYSTPKSCAANGHIKEELYDLQNDKAEEDNLILKVTTAKNRLKDELMNYLFRYNLLKNSVLTDPGTNKVAPGTENFNYLGY